MQFANKGELALRDDDARSRALHMDNVLCARLATSVKRAVRGAAYCLGFNSACSGSRHEDTKTRRHEIHTAETAEAAE